MKYLILSCLFYLLGCSSNVQTSYTYSPAKETLVKELGLNKEASDLDVQRSLKSYFAKFNITLEFSYADGKLDVKGCEKDVVVFEYVFLTMFENEPKMSVELNCKSLENGVDLKEKISIKPFQTKSVKSGESSDSEFEFSVRHNDELRFLDFTELEFDFIQFYENKKHSLSFSSVFKNGEKEHFSFNVSEQGLSCNIEGDIAVKWLYENSYFYKSLNNFIRTDTGKEIAVMPLYGDPLEDYIRDDFKSDGSLGVSLLEAYGSDVDLIPNNILFKKYLQLLGLTLNPEDVLIYNKVTRNALLYSSLENCQRFREIMRPLCCFHKKKVVLEGDFYKNNRLISTFKIPVLFNRFTELESSFENETESDLKEKSLSLSFDYLKEFFQDPIFIQSRASYESISETLDLWLSESSEDELLQGKEKLIDLTKGLSLKLKVGSYKLYE